MSDKLKGFLEAVDIVCLNCCCLSEETCKTCPVRQTVDQLCGTKG